ncbi:MAG: kelch repeat-containing protein [Verrucomicrobiota bacterium]|nr:kelch repeat-containing protein [Verrucomicrobiota bacterium]
MNDGRGLLVGGNNTKLSGPRPYADLYDPVLNTWQQLSDLQEARNHHTATLLGDGSVLIAGGVNPAVQTDSAEIFRP